MFMPTNKSIPLWMTLGKVIAGILTIIVIYFLIKEFIKAIKNSNEGKCSDKCDLD